MSHNDRTLAHATDRRPGVRMVSAALPQIDAGIWLLSEHFAIGVGPNLPQPGRKNKTASLVTLRGSAHGD
jgi:hypothetical protein